MKTVSKLHHVNGYDIKEVQDNVIIKDAQGFLDIIFNLPADRIIIHKANLDESFFELKSGLAGEILQKASNYRIRLGIIGDFSIYPSKSLRDFIYESNRYNKIVFVSTLDEALQRLSIL